MLEVKVAQTSEELNAIYQFRYDYFFRTLGRTDILGLDHKKTLHFEELDPYSVHYYIERGGKLLGVLRQTRLGAVPDDVIKSNGIDEIYNLDRFLSIVDKSQLSMDFGLFLTQQFVVRWPLVHFFRKPTLMDYMLELSLIFLPQLQT